MNKYKYNYYITIENDGKTVAHKCKSYKDCIYSFNIIIKIIKDKLRRIPNSNLSIKENKNRKIWTQTEGMPNTEHQNIATVIFYKNTTPRFYMYSYRERICSI